MACREWLRPNQNAGTAQRHWQPELRSFANEQGIARETEQRGRRPIQACCHFPELNPTTALKERRPENRPFDARVDVLESYARNGFGRISRFTMCCRIPPGDSTDLVEYIVRKRHRDTARYTHNLRQLTNCRRRKCPDRGQWKFV
jgi:hypothetical protein